jgi:hypothetical protein
MNWQFLHLFESRQLACKYQDHFALGNWMEGLDAIAVVLDITSKANRSNQHEQQTHSRTDSLTDSLTDSRHTASSIWESGNPFP